jgi:cardiolipin synthase
VWHFVTEWWFWIDWGATVLALVSIPSVLVKRRARPTAALSWILALVAMPYIGLLSWWLFGRTHLERRRRQRRHKHETIAERLERLRGDLDEPPTAVPGLVPLNDLPDEVHDSVFPQTAGNRVELYANGTQAFEGMEELIKSAERHIHALFYIWQNDETGRRFRDLLVDKAREGVTVRVLCDAVGSPAFNTSFATPLRKAGAKVRRFLPPQFLSLTPRVNFRNHRKILVVDGKTGVIGGFNIGHEYRTLWRDMGVQIEGPAVDQLQEIFTDDWYYCANEDLADPDYFGCWELAPEGEASAVAVVSSGPDSHYEPIHDAIFMAINRADKRVDITTPYFIPSKPILAAIRSARFRGVDVRLMLPALNDVRLVRYAARSYYQDLLEVGARIFEYQPAMLHAKVLTFDDDLVIIGSANLDSRSFKLNFEASCFVGGEQLNRELTAVFEDDLKSCVEVDPAAFAKRPWGSRLVDSAAHLLSPLL